MPYTPPIFNLLANAWLCDGTVKPSNGAPDLTDIPVQKYLSSRAAWPVNPPWHYGFYLISQPPVQIRTAHAGAFAGSWRDWKVTCLEVPAGSGQYYRAFWGEIEHEGFPNEYAILVVVQCDEDLLAVPPAGSTEAAGVGGDACGNIPDQEPQVNVLPPAPWPPTTTPPTGFLDTFIGGGWTDLDEHIANTGETWTEGKPLQQADGSGFGVIAIDTTFGDSWYVANYSGDPTTDILFEFDSPSDTSNGCIVGLIYNATDENNFFAAILNWNFAGDWDLGIFEFTAGTGVQVQAGTAFSTLNSSQPHAITLSIVGASVTAKLYEGTTLLQTTNYTHSSSITEPKIGIYAYVSATVPACRVWQISR